MRRGNLRRAIINRTPERLLALGVRMSSEHSSKLNEAEQRVLWQYEQDLLFPRRPYPLTKKLFVIGMVGTVGSGKTTTAEMIAERIGAVVIRGDDIRLRLRDAGQRYEATRKIAEQMAVTATSGERRTNIVIDTDFVDKEKRVALSDAVNSQANTLFLRITADPDVVFSRIRETDYGQYENIFRVAGTKSTVSDKAVDVRLREMWRRTPRHYEWDDSGGGRWHLRDMPFVFDTIDTTDEVVAVQAIENVAERMKNL